MFSERRKRIKQSRVERRVFFAKARGTSAHHHYPGGAPGDLESVPISWNGCGAQVTYLPVDGFGLVHPKDGRAPCDQAGDHSPFL